MASMGYGKNHTKSTPTDTQTVMAMVWYKYYILIIILFVPAHLYGFSMSVYYWLRFKLAERKNK